MPQPGVRVPATRSTTIHVFRARDASATADGVLRNRLQSPQIADAHVDQPRVQKARSRR
jgi:hypothetical protein